MAILFCKLGNVQNIMIESMRNSELVVAASQNSIRLRMAVQAAWQDYACNNKYELLQTIVWKLGPLVMAFWVYKRVQMGDAQAQTRLSCQEVVNRMCCSRAVVLFLWFNTDNGASNSCPLRDLGDDHK